MPRKPEQTWFQQAVDLIVRQGMPMRQACLELNLDLTSAECDRVYRTKAFQECLRAERHRLNTEIANDPGRTKNSLVGLAYDLITKLILEGQYDKAVDSLLKLAKLEGWDKSSEITIFAGLTAKDIEVERERILAETKATDSDLRVN